MTLRINKFPFINCENLGQKWPIPENDLNLQNYNVIKCAKNGHNWDKMFWSVDNMIIPCYMNVIDQEKWSGLALGANWARSDIFAKNGLKAPKSTFKTRYMTYNKKYYISMAKNLFGSLVAQNAPFWAQNSPKYHKCYINPAKL